MWKVLLQFPYSPFRHGRLSKVSLSSLLLAQQPQFSQPVSTPAADDHTHAIRFSPNASHRSGREFLSQSIASSLHYFPSEVSVHLCQCSYYLCKTVSQLMLQSRTHQHDFALTCPESSFKEKTLSWSPVLEGFLSSWLVYSFTKKKKPEPSEKHGP